MGKQSILAQLLTNGQVKKLNKIFDNVQEFLNEARNEGFETYVMYVYHTKEGIEIFCTEELVLFIDNKFLQFGMEDLDRMSFNKWFTMFKFVLLDLDKSVNWGDSLFFSE